MKTILQTENLTKSFGQLMAVNRVDIEFREGELTSIIGPNGAGKTRERYVLGETISPDSPHTR
jgi:ABC-type branched-subunit amino acid transport system ATPase component